MHTVVVVSSVEMMTSELTHDKESAMLRCGDKAFQAKRQQPQSPRCRNKLGNLSLQLLYRKRGSHIVAFT